LVDIASYMNIWWLRRAAREVSEALLRGLPRTEAWRARIKDIGHGERSEMSGADALAVAKAAKPAAAPAHDPSAAAGLAPGAAVAVRADDYGRDPIVGSLVAATAERVVIAREDPAVGLVHVHFPRAGYLLAAA
jgi:hypothetical protein